MRLKLCVIFILAALDIMAAPPLLKKTDVRATMGEMFAYHVEHKILTPLLVKRSFKIYIEQFDPLRIYLLQKEVKPFLELSDERVSEIIQDYYEDRFSAYEALNQVIVKAIKRSDDLRAKLKTSRIEPASSLSYSSFASDQAQLFQRIQKQFANFLAYENSEKSLSPERQEKLFVLWDKRLRRSEKPYISDDKKKEYFLTLHVLKALAKSLDAHSSYYSPEEAFDLRTMLEKQFEGVGVVLRETVDGVTVSGFIKGGPAERSGKISVGDLVVAINRKSMEGLSYEELLEKMKGGNGQPIVLGLKRADGSLVEVELIREKISMDDERVKYTAVPVGDGFVGVLDLPSFYESADGSSCEKDLREAIKALKTHGKLLGLVLDMRENGGGFLSQAVKVAGLFITSGVVVISKYAEGEVQYLRDIDGRVYYSGPLVILTSRASASAAEIVAQALQDYGTALVVGDERTYGKGSIQYQTVTDAEASAFFKVTVGKYYTVSGKSTQIEGVKADITVPTLYSAYRIGERFLEYPLANDQVPPAYLDSLVDMDGRTKQWFQKNYLPYLHKKDFYWRKMLPTLDKNSAFRLKNNKDFSLFLKHLEQAEDPSTKENWGVEDLQMLEAFYILQDMIFLQAEHPLISR